ncbi:MAG: TolC family protein [Pyrinomonadaceae bacterium]
MQKSHNIFKLILLLTTILGLALGVLGQDGNQAVASNNRPEADPAIPTSSVSDVNSTEVKELQKSFLRRVGVNVTQTRSLTLDQAIRLALDNNNGIEIARDDVRIAESGLRSIEGTYDPTLNFTPNYSRNQTNGQSATNDVRVNSNITKLISQGGGNYQFFFNNSRTENAFAQAQATSGNIGSSSSSGIFVSSLGVSYTQPLLRDFRVDNTRRQIKIQKRRIAQSDADFRRQTIETVSQVQKAYWDLVFALRDQQNRVANLNLSKENLRQVEARIAAGAAAPLQRAEVATELANRESDVLVASQSVSIAENVLKQLLLKDPLAPEWNESLTPTDSPSFDSTSSVDLQAAISDAIANRPELSRLRLEKEINEVDISYFRNQTKPRIDFTSTFSLNGIAQSAADSTTSQFLPLISGDPSTNANAYLLNQIRLLNGGSPTDSEIPLVEIPPTPTFLTGGYSQAVSNLFRSDSRNYSFGLTISFPLRNSTAKANLATAEFQQSRLASQVRAQEQSIITEVRNAVQAVETSKQRVVTARRARENAEIQLDGERKLYDSGRSTTFLLFQRENALTNARNSEIRAETDYNKALADLQRVTSTTLTTNNIVVDSPVDDSGN